MMIRRAFLGIAAIAALLVAVAGLAVAPPAHAAPKPIGLSVDGITFTDTLPSSLFGGVVIVPGTSVTRTFYVKNRATTAGNFAVALKDVTGGDSNLIAALWLRAVAGPSTGPAVPFTAATPCHSLLSGVTLAAGAIMQVDVRLMLSNTLHNKASQGSVGNFLIPVTMTSTDVPAPTGCSSSTPTPGGGGATGEPTPPGTIDTAVISGAADGSVLPTLAEGPLSGLGGDGSVYNSSIEPNTARFFQEFDVVWWLVALMLGGIFAWYRRRNESLEEVY